MCLTTGQNSHRLFRVFKRSKIHSNFSVKVTLKISTLCKVKIQINMTTKNIAIIGAGPWGLCAAKNSLQQGAAITVYERSEALGGTWRYVDETGKDKYGLDIHTAMYKDLRYFIKIILIDMEYRPELIFLVKNKYSC